MWFVILNILKIIAIVFGLLLAVILFLFVFIMAAPLSYKIIALSGAKKSASVKARWLFGIVGVKTIYKNSKTTVTTYVCGFALKDRKTKKSDEKHESAAPAETDGKQLKPATDKKTKQKKVVREKKAGPLQMITEIINYPDKKLLIDKTKLLIKRLYRTARPKYFYLGGEVGFDAPHHTGYMLAALGVLRGLKNTHFDITPNMEEKAFDVVLKINGRVTLFGLSLPILLFILTAPVRRIIKIYRKNKPADAENEKEKGFIIKNRKEVQHGKRL